MNNCGLNLGGLVSSNPSCFIYIVGPLPAGLQYSISFSASGCLEGLMANGGLVIPIL